ncbi:MAG: ferritin family protein [candidate division WOR-3 bacterium]
MSVNQDILTGLKEAMIAERTGIEFYQAAAEKTVDPQGKEVFLRLADEERRHLEYLRRQFENVFNNSGFEPLTDKSKIDLEGASPIFSEEIKGRLKSAHWEMSALSVGLALEQASISRYQELAKRAEKPDAKEFFLALVRWEQTHLAALQKQFNYLREFYWEQAGFAPF